MRRVLRTGLYPLLVALQQIIKEIIIALLTVGAVGRITRFIVDDTLFKPIHTAVQKRSDQRFFVWLGDLIACSWCTSIWIAASAGVAHWLWHSTTGYFYIVAVLTTSHIVSLAASWLDSPPPPRHIVLEPFAADMSIHDQRR